jgi:prenyltransferase beta subunit
MRTSYVFAVSICLIGGPLRAQQATPQDRATIGFLNSLRNADGGYAPAFDKSGTQGRSSLRATLSAVRALRYLGDAPQGISATARFVENCFDRNTGGFGDFPGDAPTVPLTAVGAMARVDLKLPPESYRDGVVKFLNERVKTLEDMRIAAAAFESLQLKPAKVDDWLRQIAADRNPDGTFGAGPGSARSTGGTEVMILRLGGAVDHRDTVLKVMRAGQRSDGGFGSAERDGSDLESTYRVMRSFAMLKERPVDVDKLRSFIAKCRSANGGYGIQPGQPPTAAGTYYAAIVTHWLDELQDR